MRKTNTKVSKAMNRDIAKKLFADAKVGLQSYKPLEHKDGSKFKDIDYFELLGRKCMELDKKNKNPNLPTDYGKYDRNVCEVAKEVCRGIDNGMSKEELQQYLDICIDIEK